MLLLAQLACSPLAEGWRNPASRLVVDTAPFDFGTAPIDTTATATLPLRNDGDLARTFAVSTLAPFSTGVTTITVGAEGSAGLLIIFAPEAYGPASGTLVLADASETFAIALSGTTDPDSDGDGAEAAELGGADCDDRAAEVHPGAADDCYDGVDADCAADDDDDCDHDGAALGPDCDDGDPTVHPGAAESEADGLDSDCDGLVDEALLSAGELVLSEIHPAAPAWVEVCSRATRAVALDGMVLRTATSSATLAAGALEPGACGAICASATAGCAWQADLLVTVADDVVRLGAGALVLDAVAITEEWRYAAGGTWSLDPAFDASSNNRPEAWCLSDGSPGSPNPACP